MSKKEQKNKKEGIDLSEDRMLDMASSFTDDHNYLGALKMLHKNAGLNGIDDRTFMMYAEIYDDLDMHEESINNWFKYLDCSPDPDFAEAYEGLAVNYMMLDDERLAAYYYNKMLIETDDLSEEERQDIIDQFIKRDVNPLKVCYPPEKADNISDINEGIDYIRSRQPEKAIECFSRVEKGNPKYMFARNYIAMAYILDSKPDKAEEECNYILSVNPNDVHALTTLTAVRADQKRTDEARELAERLADMDVTIPEDIYKIATVCCENKLHAKAYELFSKLDYEQVNSDRNFLYFKAIAAYNSGNFEACFDCFDKLTTLHPDAVVAQYYYNYVRENAKKEDREELKYFYRLPMEMRKSSLEIISAILSLSKTEVRKLCETVDILGVIKWCFDESDGPEESELQYAGAMCAVRAGYDDYIRDILLNAFMSDNIKLIILRALGERNEDNQFGVVICNIYNTIDYYHMNLGRSKRKCFVDAYAILISRFAIMDETYSAKFASVAEEVYKTLEKHEALGLCKDSETLAAVIASKIDLKQPDEDKFDVCDFFDADKRRYDEIKGVLQQD